MKGDVVNPLSQACTQAEFAALVGIEQQSVSQLVAKGVLAREGTAEEWLISYCSRLREQAAGRDLTGALAQERAALAREQRIGQEIKNRLAQGEYAPIGLLGDVLATASAAVVDRFDALPGTLRKVCPELPANARDAIDKVIASARNEWVRSTSDLVVKSLADLTDDADDIAPGDEGVDDEGPAE